MALILDRDQLCAALGISDSSITAWEKKGLPTVRKGRGRGMKSLYDLDQVRAWCDESGYGHSLQALVARFMRQEPPAAPAPSERDAESGGDSMGIVSAHEAALFALPALLHRAGLSEASIDAVIASHLEALAAELARRGVEARAEMVSDYGTMIAEERARPGTWTS